MIVVRFEDAEAFVLPDSERERLIRDPLNYPMPAIVAKIVWFPEGNEFAEIPDRPYINWLGYNGRQGLYAPGYYTVQRLYL